MTRTTLVVPALVLGLLATTTACGESTPQADGATTTAAQPASSPIVGEWTMTSLELGTEGNLAEVPYSGQVIFTEAGTMAVQAANPDTAAPDTAFTVAGYEAYYGPVTVDDAAGTLTIQVESAAARDVVGQSLTRVFAVTGSTLVLTPVDPADGFRATYERTTDA